MKRRSDQFFTFSLVLFSLCCACSTRAQVIEGVRPATMQGDVFAGYSYLGGNTSVSGARVNLNGASGSIAFDVNDWLAVVGDVGAYHQGNIAASGLSLTVATYQFGPRLRLQTHSRLSPFAQVLIGGGHASGTLYTTSLGPGLALLGANSSFVLTAGGGLDWKRSEASWRRGSRVNIRLIQAEYLHSQFLNGGGNGNHQNNLRLSAGIIFALGNN